jgi:hypothetical protein
MMCFLQQVALAREYDDDVDDDVDAAVDDDVNE